MARTLIRVEQFDAIRFFDPECFGVRVRKAGHWVGSERSALGPHQIERFDELYAWWMRHSESFGDAVSMADFDVDAVTLLGRLA